MEPTPIFLISLYASRLKKMPRISTAITRHGTILLRQRADIFTGRNYRMFTEQVSMSKDGTIRGAWDGKEIYV